MLIFSRLIFFPFLSWSSIISEKYKRISKLLSLLQKQELYSFCELSYKSVYILPFLTERNSSSSPKCSTKFNLSSPSIFLQGRNICWYCVWLKFQNVEIWILWYECFDPWNNYSNSFIKADTKKVSINSALLIVYITEIQYFAFNLSRYFESTVC